jgi:DNA gyrase/topoisomerase IV subunit B
MSKKKTIEETYQKVDQREHVLLRPGMYIGSIKKHLEEMYVYDPKSEKIVKKMIEYSPGFIKIFDEILTNALDHSSRDPTLKSIKVDFDKETGLISVWNDGMGIPVVEHREHKIYVPELIFGHLLSGQNYDDTQQRTGAGTNGLGSKVVSIYSKQFVVETIDSKEGLKFVQEHSDNMTKKTKAKITKNSGKSYTKISFIADFARFGMIGLEKDTLLLLTKRVYDCIATTNQNVSIYLNGEKLKGKGLVDYTKYYFEESKVISESNSQQINKTDFFWEYCIIPHSNFEQVSFVNGNATFQGGKHVDYIMNQIVNKLKTMLETKKKLKELKPSFIKDRMFLFLRATVVNPSFNSQTKEQLTTASKDFGCKIEVSDKFIEKIYKSSITDEIVEFCKYKEASSLAKTTDGKKISNVYIPKLEDAIWAGTNKSKECTLILTEGLSAMKFAMDGRAVVGPEKFGVFPLKGKLLNIRAATISQLISNEEINHIKQIVGLKQDKVYKNTDDLRYSKILILTDSDCLVGDTPLLLKDSKNNIFTDTIERLTSNFTKDLISNKEFGKSELEIWSDNGWTKIKSVIKHKVSKKIFRILTHTGIIDVTEDHPLLKEDSTEITPNNCSIGDKLLHSFPIFEENEINLPKNFEKLYIHELWKYASLFKIPYYQSYKKSDLIIKLKECKNQPKIHINNYSDINDSEAYVMGLFWADGSSGIYEWKYNYKSKNRPNEYTINRITYSWAIANNNIEFLKKAKNILENLYKLEFKIIECNNQDRLNKSYKLIINGGIKTKDIVEKYTNLFYYKNKHKYKNGNKYIPYNILNSTKNIREQFLIGYYNGDGKGHDISVQKDLIFEVEGKISAQCLFILCKSLGYEVSINNRDDILRLILTKGHQQWGKSKIKKIIDLGSTTDYVYDLETENHHFQAGVGQMIVHNCDGSHIKSLFINFIHAYWPSLIKLNFIQTLKTPIVKAIKGKKILEFYTEQDYHKWQETIDNTNGYQIKYFKGLGTSTKEDAKNNFQRFQELKVDYYYKDNKCDESILLAFDKDKNVKSKKKVDENIEDEDIDDENESTTTGTNIKCTDKRKVWLGNYDKSSYIDVKENRVSYQDQINKELIHFSIYDNTRSIPNLCDGLKPSQRKILYYMLKKNVTKDIKVAQLSGYISAEMAYHHGETSLQGAIINMAQNYVGSNNINLLFPNGNFGSRFLCGADAASPRYIFTRLENYTTQIYNVNDLPLLNQQTDDGQDIEPEFLLPILPMILVNGCSGIGTGYSTNIPPYNPKDIISNLKRIINNKEPLKMTPWFKNFNGTVLPLEKEGSFETRGKWTKLSDTQIKITELPIGMGVTTYKEFLENLIESNTSKKETKQKKNKIVLKDVQNKTTDENTDICFIIEFKNTKDLSNLIKNNTLEKDLKLTKIFSTTNMYLFDEDTKLLKYNDPNDILSDWSDIRLEYYQKRKDYIIEKLQKESIILNSKARFIRKYIDGELDINKKSKDVVINLLEKNKFPLVEDSYNYLLSLPMSSLTLERIKALEKECESKQAELIFIKSKSKQQLWEIDLDELIKSVN